MRVATPVLPACGALEIHPAALAIDSHIDDVTRELRRRDYTELQIRKPWGASFVRVLRAAERVAHTERTASQ